MATDPKEATGSSSSVSASQERSGGGGRGRELKRTKSNLLRNFVVEADIKSTVELVEAYNRTAEGREREALHEWLKLYVKWFNDKRDSHVAQGAIDEFASLSRVVAREPEDKWLVQDVLSALVSRVEKERIGAAHSTPALSNALHLIDEDLFLGDSEILFNAVSVLLDKLDPSTTPFIRETSKSREAALLALHQALLLIHHVAPNRLSPNEKAFYQRTKARLDEIRSETTHFPIIFQVEAAKQSLERLVGRESGSVTAPLRRCIKGLLYLYSGVRHAAAADIDVESLERGYKELKDAYGSQRGTRKYWYDALVELNCAARFSQMDPGMHSAFVESFENLMKDQHELDGIEDRKLLAFGIILQLRMLATSHGPESIRTKAIDEIAQLALTYTLCDDSYGDPAVVEALLDALMRICADEPHREDVEQTLRTMVDDAGKAVGDALDIVCLPYLCV